MSELRTTDNAFIGPDVETIEGLSKLFPHNSVTKRCDCVDAGVILRKVHSIDDEKRFSLPQSITVLCCQCQTPYYHA